MAWTLPSVCGCYAIMGNNVNICLIQKPLSLKKIKKSEPENHASSENNCKTFQNALRIFTILYWAPPRATIGCTWPVGCRHA